MSNARSETKSAASNVTFTLNDEDPSVYEVRIPCPYCGSSHLRELDVTLSNDEGEHNVLMVECLDCDAQARKEKWNNRVTNWILGNISPEPGERVLVVYRKPDGTPSNPIVSTPIHEDGSHLDGSGKSIYRKIIAWMPIPPRENFLHTRQE